MKIQRKENKCRERRSMAQTLPWACKTIMHFTSDIGLYTPQLSRSEHEQEQGQVSCLRFIDPASSKNRAAYRGWLTSLIERYRFLSHELQVTIETGGKRGDWMSEWCGEKEQLVKGGPPSHSASNSVPESGGPWPVPYSVLCLVAWIRIFTSPALLFVEGTRDARIFLSHEKGLFYNLNVLHSSK